MPRKVFTAGEVLAAADVNSFLMDQTVMTFAGTAARGSAIGTATEGMYAHLNDTDTLTYYNGSAWVNREGAALTLINTTSFTGVTSQSVNNVFTSTYDNYRIMISITNMATDGLLTMKMRASGSDTSTGYYTNVMGILENGTAENMTAANTSSWSINDIDGVSATGATNSTVIELFNPERNIPTSATLVANGQNAAGFLRGFAGGLWSATATSFDGFTIGQAGNIAGTIRVYGYKN
jgi:hypothetical protein